MIAHAPHYAPPAPPGRAVMFRDGEGEWVRSEVFAAWELRELGFMDVCEVDADQAATYAASGLRFGGRVIERRHG